MNKTDHLFDKYKKEGSGKKSLWRILAGMMAVIVTFVTTYSLILPAITVSVDQFEEVPGLYLDEEDYGYEIVEDKEEMPESSLTTVGESAVDTGMEGIWDEEFIEDDDPLTETESESEEAGINPAPEIEIEPDYQVETKITAETEINAEPETGTETETEFAAETETEFAAETEAEAEPETEAQQLTPAQVFYDRAEGIRVIVNAPEGTFPEGTTMTVNRVEDEEILQGIEEAAVTKKTRVTRMEAVDICFLDKDGEEIEPQQPISVRIVTDVSKPEEEAVVVHMDDNGQTETLSDASVKTKGNSEEVVSFEAEHFSVYAVVYTVDFEYSVNGKTFQFSLPGGESITLSDLFEALNIIQELNSGDNTSFENVQDFLKEVDSVEFSDESLVKVTQIEDDWELESLAPFDTEESLVITMKNGDVFTIQVTDAQISADVLTASGETYTITVEYDDDAEIPDDAKLNVTEILPEDEEFAEYHEKAHLALGDDIGVEDVLAQYARFFDITILSGDRKIEPQADVSVSITLKDAVEAEGLEWNLVHFENELPDVLTMEKMEDEATEATTIAFVTDSFSVFGMVTTFNPSAASDLHARTSKIGVGNFYLTQQAVAGNPQKIGKTSSEDAAAEWYFETTGENGVYFIYTLKNNVKQYINFTHYNESDANVFLSNTPQGLNVSKVENEDKYLISWTDEHSHTYYLNQHSGEYGQGFAGWQGWDDANSKLTFSFNPLDAKTFTEYMVVVKQGEAYYVVMNDGTLSPADYNPTDNTVAVDDPMMWRYDGDRLYHVTREAGFTGDDIPSDSYYRYIDPNASSGLNEDDETNTTATGDLENRRDVHITARNLWDSVKFSYTDHKLQSISNPSYYIGVEQGRLKGQASAEEAVEVFLANPFVHRSNWREHSVGHIDISINGSAEADVPLAYGKYYDENGNLVKEVELNQFERLHLTKYQVVNEDDLSITPEDMKRSRITAVCNGKPLDNAFYITGYSGNAQHGGQAGGETDYITSPQVRIEGSFLVAKMPENHATVNMELYDSNETYRNDIRQEHLENQVEYNVSVTKSVEFYLQMPVLDNDGEQLTDEDGNPVYQQLYDADGTALTIKVDLSFSDSFTYWDSENECPVFKDTDRWYYYKNYKPTNVNDWNEDDWENGDIARCGFSGMDFKLGGSGYKPNSRVYAIEIAKVVVDEQGNRIKSDNIGTTKFNIYQKPVELISSASDSSGNEYLDVVPADADEVKDLNIGSFTSDGSYTEGYGFLRDKTIQVGNDGFGLVYDYDVTPALYYIEEDPDSVAESITDTTGKQWDYKQTYIWTEYAWRNCSNDNFMHVGKTYAEKPEEGGYKGVPEILGNHYGYDGDDGPYTNDFLEFYVYNVYESPKVDVPVIKSWPDYDGEGHEEYDWQAEFKLQWAPLYPDEDVPTVAFQDVTPAQTMTITKADMHEVTQELVQRYLDGDNTLTSEEKANVETVTFRNLPKYGTDTNGNTFRYQYSLEETSYQVINSTTGVIVYSWSEDEGYNDPEEGHYVPYYPHDAGETMKDNTTEQNEADTNYYVQVDNRLKTVTQDEHINISLEKQWDIDDNDSFDTRDNTYWAEFELRRFVHTEYRDLSHMSDADRTADPVTVTVKDSSGNTISTIQVQPNMGLYLGGNFKPHDSTQSAVFVAEPAVRLVNDSRTTTITVTASGENMSNALVRSPEFFVTQDTTITLSSGGENLVEGNMAKALDTASGTNPLPDRSYSQTIRLDNSNNWKETLADLLRSETTEGEGGNENVTLYEYYLVEKDSNPKGYAQYFRADADGNPTTVLSGDSDHQIESNDSIIAANGPSNRLIVKKQWRGVPDTTGFPKVYFTLYQGWLNSDGRISTNNGDSWVFEDPDTGAKYEHIELSGRSLEWICPQNLPETRADNNGTSRKVGYYVQEDKEPGQNEPSGTTVDDGITVSWEFYYYINSNGDKHNDATQGNRVGFSGEELKQKGGSITICNALNSYRNLDIKKQFFSLNEQGSWSDITSPNSRWANTILGFKVLRAVKTADGDWLDESGNESSQPVWLEYSEEMLCGYDGSGKPIVQHGPNDIFDLQLPDVVGGDWHFRIENNNGDASPNSNGLIGLPNYGFYIKNGKNTVVEYWYTILETNVYRFVSQDGVNGTIHVAEYPEWDWFSSNTPILGFGPNNQQVRFFEREVEGDSDRIVNFQASNLIVDKDWIGTNNPTAQTVYIKVWRQADGGEIEDFTKIIADDIRNNNSWQNYVNNTDIIDLNRNCLVLSRDGSDWTTATLKINRALLGTIGGSGSKAKTYHYYIQEVGYRTNSGEYRTDVNNTFKPLYDRWTGTETEGAYTGTPVGMNDYAENNIMIGSKGENRLKVINSTEPSTSYTVTKAFHGPQSSTGGQSSVTGKYPTDGSKHVVLELQQRYRYEKTEDGVDYVSSDNETWVRADSEEAKTTWCNYSSNEGWQSAESASPTSVVLPQDKPEGSILSDEAWYGSAAAWTYTWEGLDVVKVVSNTENPENSLTAQLYYRAVEVGTPDWFNSVIATEEQDGHKAVDDSQQTIAQILTESNTVTNERKDCSFELNKEWTGLGEGKTWPDNVTIDYQLVQYFHLALTDMSHIEDGHIVPGYSIGGIFKSVEMSTNNTGAATADSVHPQAIGLNVGKPSDGSTVIANITGLPVYGFLTATEDDVAEAEEHGVTLVAGKVYPVVYTYGAKETAVKRNGIQIPFREQTVEAVQVNTVTNAIAYKATLTNELVSVTVEKRWDGLTPSTEESATIGLYRFEKEPEETTFQYTVNVTGDSEALSSDGTVTVTIYDEDDQEVASYTLKQNDWSHDFNLGIGGTYHAAFEGDGTILNTAVTPSSASNITKAGKTDLTAVIKSSEPATRSITVIINYPGHTDDLNRIWLNLWNSWWEGQNTDGSLNNNKTVSNGTLTATVSGVSTSKNYGIQIGGINNFFGLIENSPGYNVRPNDSNQVLLDCGTGTEDITITINLAESGGGAQEGTATLTINNTTSNGMWLNALTKNSTAYSNNGAWINANDSMTIRNLPAGDTYTIQMQGTPAQFSGDCIKEVDDWNGNCNLHLSIADGSENTITISNARSVLQSGKMLRSSIALKGATTVTAKASLRAPATITWTNNTDGLPEGADPTKDECVETVTFSVTTWSKTWTELPKYSEDGKEYVYYAYETDFAGASGATSLETTYSTDETGKWTVKNTPTYPDLGSLKVTKEVKYGTDRDIDADDLSFTVGIFSDSAGTTRVSGQADKTITVQDGLGEATFTGLTPGTYYMYEIVDGNPVTTSGTSAVISSTEYTVTYSGNVAEVSSGTTTIVAITNTKAPYSLNILKIDRNNHTKTLDGAQFQLNKLVYDSETEHINYIENSAVNVTTENGGTAVFPNLAAGYYEIKEMNPPAGYILKGDSTFYIKVSGSGIQRVTREERKDPAEWQTATGTIGAVTYDAVTKTATVVNTPGVALPSTGGPGTRLFTILGSILILLSGTLLWRRRRWV